jgi:hypothetical protein
LERRKSKGKGGYLKGGGKQKVKEITDFDKDDLMNKFFPGSKSASTTVTTTTLTATKSTSFTKSTKATTTGLLSTSQESDSDCIDSPEMKRGPSVGLTERFRAGQGRGWEDAGVKKPAAKKKIGLMEKFGLFKKKDLEWEERRTSPRKREREERGEREERKIICVDESPPRRSPRKHKHKPKGRENQSPNSEAEKTNNTFKTTVVKKKSKLARSLER